MRSYDKKNNIKKVNLLLEERHLNEGLDVTESGNFKLIWNDYKNHYFLSHTSSMPYMKFGKEELGDLKNISTNPEMGKSGNFSVEMQDKKGWFLHTSPIYGGLKQVAFILGNNELNDLRGLF